MVRRFGRRQADMKGAEKPGMEKPGMEKPGMKKPGMKKSGMMEPGMKQPGIKHSNIGRSMIRLLAAASAAAFLLTTPVYAGAGPRRTDHGDTRKTTVPMPGDGCRVRMENGIILTQTAGC